MKTEATHTYDIQTADGDLIVASAPDMAARIAELEAELEYVKGIVAKSAWNRIAELLAACQAAFDNLDSRVESRKAWSGSDQRTFEVLELALVKAGRKP